MPNLNNPDGYVKFAPIPDYNYESGWDKYAEDYSRLLQPNTIYSLTKEVIHAIVSDYISQGPIRVLDLNCGTGNDFPFFLEKGYSIVGCDGSKGMLNKAYERYEAEITNGRIELFHGQMEQLDENSFGDKRFDLIFSVTGGYSYIDDKTFIQVNEVLTHYLKKDGVMITAHLNSFCLADLLYHVTTLRLRTAFLRLKKDLKVNIKGKPFRMFLRNTDQLKRLTPAGLRLTNMLPLLAFTPPYQTGYRVGKRFYLFHKKLELWARKKSILSFMGDQIVTIYRKKN